MSARTALRSLGLAPGLLAAAAALLLACESTPSTPDTPASPEPELELTEAEPAEPLPEALDHKVGEYIAQYGRHWPAFRFHGTVVVARGEQVAVNRAFGQADLVDDRPNEPSTLFRIGTLSAQLTAAAVMRLVEAEVLRLEDPVARHLPDWPGGKSVTIEHLLAHQSGIPNYTDDLEFIWWKKGARDIAQILEQFRGDPLEFEPGSDTAPSNSNYVLLGAVIEAATGKPYDQVVSEQVLQPLALKNTHYLTSQESKAIGMAFHEQEHLEIISGVQASAFGPAGGWLSTSGDLLRFIQGVGHHELLSRYGTMRMQGLTSDGLGYGWGPAEVVGHEAISWPGLIDGFNSAVLYIPKDDTTIIVLSNSEVIPAGQIIEDIASLAYGHEVARREEAVSVPVPIDEQTFAVGRYVPTRGTEEALMSSGADSDKINEVFVRRDNDHLVFDVPAHGTKRMHPLSRNRYFFKDGVQTRAEIVPRGGQSPLLVLEAAGGQVRFVRVDETKSAHG